MTGIVAADHADGSGMRAERPKVGHTVGGAPRGEHAALLVQDEHRSLAGDALDVAEDKLVSDEVSEHGDRQSDES